MCGQPLLIPYVTMRRFAYENAENICVCMNLLFKMYFSETKNPFRKNIMCNSVPHCVFTFSQVVSWASLGEGC